MAETSTTGGTKPARRWSDALRVYLEPASLRMFFLGFSAGLPLLLVFGTLSFWLREAGIDRTTIGSSAGSRSPMRSSGPGRRWSTDCRSRC
jgi:MFS transporter, PAT family, beta-lactamase induction signal transducer AmpG